MEKEISSAILISATPKKIWKILTDFERYSEWNSFITSVKGNVEVGKKIEIRIEQPKGSAMTFKPTVLAKIENKELRWMGSVLFRGLFDGEHCFRLIDNGNGTTTFIQSEKFNGILTWAFSAEKTEKGFQIMNLTLKELAEKSI